MKRIVLVLTVTLAALLLFGCGGRNSGGSEENVMYQTITAQEAKAIMDGESEYVILDVRTDSEYAEGHIANAILIPDYDIEALSETELPDKSAQILVYCRSGRRSALAAEKLAKLGYTNVKDFGGIIDWNYGTVK